MIAKWAQEDVETLDNLLNNNNMLVSDVVAFYNEKHTKPINIIGLKFNIEV